MNMNILWTEESLGLGGFIKDYLVVNLQPNALLCSGKRKGP